MHYGLSIIMTSLERSPRESFTTVTTNLNETTRRKMIPHERISGDYRQNKHDLRSKLSQSSHSSPSPLLGVTESLPSNSFRINAYSPYFRPASSHTVSSKRLQTSVPIPYPIQRMTLEQIGLIQGRFNIFASYMMGITHLNTPTISEDDMKAMLLMKHIFNIIKDILVIKVICTLESIDSIKSLKRSNISLLRNYKFIHILIVLGPSIRRFLLSKGFQVPNSKFRDPRFQVPSSEFSV
ncbi:hypothetical protein Avbf_13751 [Armadillidium vulgare]|nr:hypothetical protein Avbf_13751 [Armadillidium vulgare]